MNTPIETQGYKGYTIKIVRDDDVESPREWDNLGKMICFHNKYNLGDKHDYTQEQLRDIVKRKDVIALPLFLYDHSGITMSTGEFSCQWDSSQVGYIFVDFEAIKKEYSVKIITKQLRETVITVLTGEVETYDDFLTGNVYGYEVEDSEGEFIDSCYGYYGDDENNEMVNQAKGIIDYEEEKRNKKRQQVLKSLIKNGVPLQKREAALA